MIFFGALLMFVGNAMPKWMSPLSRPHCDGARLQAFQRFMAWTWALVGIAHVVVWLVAPIDLARPVSIALVAACTLAVIVQAVRLSSSRPRPAV